MASAWVQLLASCWHLFWMVTLSTWAVLFEGEVLTFCWHWSRAVVAAVAIHKKMHARWFAAVHDLTSVNMEHLSGLKCLGAIRRTPSPVAFMTKTTAVKTATRPHLAFAYVECYDIT